MADYYLLEHRNPNGDHFYTTRYSPLVAIVVHCTAGLEDLDLIGVDDSAEATARYASTTDRSVSWHSGSDTDSVIELLPASYTAWHVRNYNSPTYGHEISKKDMVWGDENPEWVRRTLLAPAAHLQSVARKAGIPIRHISKSQLDAAIASGSPEMGGFIGHDVLDPTRRTDPGKDFPWEEFLEGVRNGGDMAFSPDEEQRLKNFLAGISDFNAAEEPDTNEYGIGRYVAGAIRSNADDDSQIASLKSRVSALENNPSTGAVDATLRAKFNTHRHGVPTTAEPRPADQV